MSLLEDLSPWSHRVRDDVTLRGQYAVGSSRPIICFLHGNGFCSLTYLPLLEVLYRNYDLVLTDLQGHGDSDTGKGYPGWNALARDAFRALSCQSFIDGERPVFAVAHSLGAVMSLLMAVETPQFFERLVLLDPVLFTPWMCRSSRFFEHLGLLRYSPLSRRTRGRVDAWESRKAARDALYGRGTFRGWTNEALDAYVDHALRETGGRRVELKCPPWFEAAIFGSAPQGLWSNIRRLQRPARFLVGCDSYPFILRSAEMATRLNQHCSVMRVFGGHCFMQEDPEQSAQYVNEFLAV